MKYKEMIDSTYDECLKSLKEKYGNVDGNYFSTESCKSKNRKITRTDDGLIVHHDKENIAERLSDSTEAAKCPFEYQLGENLTYANQIEHLILHYLIYKESNGKLSSKGIANTMVDINALYENEGGVQAYRQNWYRVIKDDFDFYISFLSEKIKPIFSRTPLVLFMIDPRNPLLISNKIKKAIEEYEKNK